MKKRGLSWLCPCCRGKIYASELQRKMKCPHCLNTLYAVRNVKRLTLLVLLIIVCEVLIIEPLLELLFQNVLPHLVISLMRSTIFILCMLFANHSCLNLYTDDKGLDKQRDNCWDASGW